jgi:cytidyltransferase-like protein
MASPRVALTVGCFDPFHVGHLFHLQQARRFGDVLIVGVTRDAFVGKGTGRPVFKEHHRAAVISALAIVDQVVLVTGSLDALQRTKPDVFVLGREYDGKMLKADNEYCKANFINIAFTSGPVFSSTKLLHHYDRLAES